MLNKLITLGLTGRFFVLLALVGLIFASATFLPRLNLDAFPDVTNVQVTINTEAPGLASSEVEQLISYPIEAVMYALPDVEEVRSISKSGLSVITVVFKEKIDIYFARQLVFERLQAAKENIPQSIGTPEMGPNTSGLGQIYQYILRSDGSQNYSKMDLRALNDWTVKLMLMPIEGITEVLSFGGEVRQYQVQVIPNRLLTYNLTLQDITQAIQNNNRNAGGWYMQRGNEQLVIRGVGWIRGSAEGIQDILNIPLKEKNGSVVYIKDVAQVKFGGEIRQGAVTMTRKDKKGTPEALGEVVTGIILKRLGANTKSTIDSITERLPLIQEALPKGIVIEPIYDQSSLIEKAVETVTNALIQAFILIVIVLFLFLLNLRAASLVLLSIPLSILMALIMMAQWGLSANLMSLGGMAIATGMMVDGSVVMMENIFRHLSVYKAVKKSNIEGDIQKIIRKAAHGVGRSVFFAVLIIITVFLPLFSLEGVEGKLFKPMALSIILTMIGSLIVALLVLPPLASFLFRKGVRERQNKPLIWLERKYRSFLTSCLKNSKKTIAISVVLFLFSLSLIPFLGTEFIPELEEGTLNIRVTLAPSSSLDTALEVAQKLEKRLIIFPEVLFISSRIGRAELGGDPEPVSNIELLVGLKQVKDWTSAKNRIELQKLMEKEMSAMPGLLFSFSQPIATRVDELLSGVKAQLAIKFFGPDLNILNDKGKAIERLTAKTIGTRDVAMEQVSGEEQLVIIPNRKKLARYGLSIQKVMELISDGIGGTAAGQVIQGNERYDIYVRFAEKYRQDISRLSDLTLLSSNGAWVRLGDVAEIKLQKGYAQIRRDNLRRRIVIQSNVEGRDMGGLVAELNRKINSEIDLPAGYNVEMGGQYENQKRAQEKLMIVIPISMGLIFLLLYFAFTSFRQASLVMLNVPMALIGGIIALFVTGQYLSVPGSIGFITLFGIAILNGVVLVGALNERRALILSQAASESFTESLIEATVSRLRPVLMTAITSMLGLIPLLLSVGIGSEVQKPLATVVVGGIISSSLLTLILLPVIFNTVKIKEKLPE